MKEIIVSNQQELDALSLMFEDYTRIVIKNTTQTVVVHKAWGNSSVEAWGNSSVEARGNSSVVARENSSVEAWGNSSVEARGNSSVVARENSSVVARENSSVEARGNSSVVAWGNSSVVAWGNSSVEAWGNSSVEARGNSSVAGYELAVIIVFSCLLLKLCHLSTAFLRGVKKTQIKTFKKAKTATVILQPRTFTHTKKSYLEINKPDKGGYLTLFKSVNPKNNRDFRTDTIEYKVGSDVVCPDWDPNPERECGGGLHLCQTAMTANSYNRGKLLKCKAHKNDVVVFGGNVSKVRCKKVTVIEEVNLSGAAICK